MWSATHGVIPRDPREFEQKVDAAGWGLLLVWVGVAILANVGWGAGILGVGVLALGGQVVRKAMGLRLDGFGMFVGLVATMWGIWQLLDLGVGAKTGNGFFPILMIVSGAAILASAIRQRR